MRLLAYGEFDTFELPGMYLETLPFVARLIVSALCCYVPATLVAERARYREVAVFGYVILAGLLLSRVVVMGAYGPAHVGLEVGGWAYPLLFVCLVGKVVILRVGDLRRSWKRATLRRATFPAS